MDGQEHGRHDCTELKAYYARKAKSGKDEAVRLSAEDFAQPEPEKPEKVARRIVIKR